MNEEDKLKKDLEKKMKQITDESQFEQSMGERENPINFSPGVADDLVQMYKEPDPEEE